MLITPEWLKDKIKNEPESSFEIIHGLRTCELCKNEIVKSETSSVYLGKLYHFNCIYCT